MSIEQMTSGFDASDKVSKNGRSAPTTSYNSAIVRPMSIGNGLRIRRCIKFYSRGLLLLSTVLLIFFSVDINEVNADTTIPLTVEACSDETIGGMCNDWGPWYQATRVIYVKSFWYEDAIGRWHQFNCPITIRFAWRECYDDGAEMLRQYDIFGFTLDLDYKIYLVGQIKYTYPCRDALYILTGTKAEVSKRLNSLYGVIMQEIIMHDYTEFFKFTDKLYPGNTFYNCNSCAGNELPAIIVSSKATCQGQCLVYDAQYPILINDFLFDYTKVPLQLLADEYNNGDTNGMVVEPLSVTPVGGGEGGTMVSDLDFLNDYIQTEINPLIFEPGFIPVFLSSVPRPDVHYVNCGSDPNFCCIDKYVVCRDFCDNKKIKITHTVETGTIPTECLTYTKPNRKDCPPSIIPAELIQCTENCTENPPPIPPSQYIFRECISGITITPNPTHNGTTLTFTLLTSGNLTITLVDLEGKELVEIHNAQTEAGEFTKTFSMSKFPKGVYFIKIKHNGNIKTEQIIRN